MDFLFYKDFKYRMPSDHKFTIDLCEDQITRYGVDYLVAWRPSTTCIVNESSGILLSGRVKYKTETILESVSSLYEAINSGNWPLNDNFTGIFSGITFNDNALCIFNDPIGLFHIYYCITSEYVAVSTNLTAIQKITKKVLKLGAVLLEITGPEFSQFGKSTVLKDVFTLLPGELLRIGRKGATSLYDTTIKKEDKTGNKNLANEFVNLINSEFHDFYNDEKPILVSLSGGIDSRVNLAALIYNNKRPALSNYGTPESIDSLIPKRIADQFNLELEVLDPVQFQFPSKSVLQKVIKETDSLYGNLWLAILENHKDDTRYSRMLLGDMCDILRSKRDWLP